MDDLVRYANREDVDPITQAAVAHAQFETIPPYADGNGRIGRVLVGWMLAGRLAVYVPSPVSLFMARDRGGYLAGLTLFRAGQTDQWVAWFAEVVTRSSLAMVGVVDDVARLLDQWALQLADTRADAAAQRLLRLLPGLPLVSSSLVAERLGVSERAGRSALQLLGELGILVPTDLPRQSPGRPAHWWLAEQVVRLVSPGVS
jgi:Fic family protein